jgi:hypothetical protein
MATGPPYFIPFTNTGVSVAVSGDALVVTDTLGRSVGLDIWSATLLAPVGA